uniref:protein acetyllysine N-acetyltransferase n=1 Tax=Ornithodoros turicata TaxID=34597 RepID=A0A2R5L6L7_9ACAR
MADQRQPLCAAPAYKRPRLENDCNVLGLSMPNGVADVPEGFNGTLCKIQAPNDVTASSDPNSEMCNGDSGFHELASTNGTDLMSSDGSPVEHGGMSVGVENSGPIFLGTLTSSEEPKEEEPKDTDEVASTISNLSGLSDSSDTDWKSTSEGPMGWVQRQMSTGADPRVLLQHLLPGAVVPANMDQLTLWKVLVSVIREEEPPRRTKLPHINTIEDVVGLLKRCRKVVVLTGAGVSVSCGIPDFRSRNGIYARLSKDFPALPDPQAMFDIHYFRKDPRPFFKFAKEIYPGQFTPSPSHRFIKLLEDNGQLLRNYTQNIDTLEQTCGIQNVITCHGSFATASCTRCRHKVDSETIKDDIFSQRIPACPMCPQDCPEMAVMKPDIVFFGEGLSEEFHQSLARDKSECDLLIVMGSSLKVRPVALIPSSVPPDIPQILINREPLKHVTFDVELLGDCDVIIRELCNRLGWNLLGEEATQPLVELSGMPLRLPTPEPDGVSNMDTLDSEGSGQRSTLTSPSLDPSEQRSEKQKDGLWKPRASIASRLPVGHYLYTTPSTYVFSGAEVYSDDSDSASEESDTDSLRSSLSDEEEEVDVPEDAAAPNAPVDSPPFSQGNTMDCEVGASEEATAVKDEARSKCSSEETLRPVSCS